jgi:hypothetical protein
MFVLSGTNSFRLCLFWVVPIHFDYVSTMFVLSGNESVPLKTNIIGTTPSKHSRERIGTTQSKQSRRIGTTPNKHSRDKSVPLICLFWVVQICLNYVCFEWYWFVSTMFFLVVPIHLECFFKLRWFCLDYVCLKWYRFVSTMFVWSGTDSSRLCLFGVVPIP